jgi:hypothetical protein
MVSWMVMDKEVLLHIIDGPGATWGWIAFGFFGMVTILYIVKWMNGYDQAMAAGREAERREGLFTIKAQMAKLSFDQQQIMDRIQERSNAVDEQVG